MYRLSARFHFDRSQPGIGEKRSSNMIANWFTAVSHPRTVLAVFSWPCLLYTSDAADEEDIAVPLLKDGQRPDATVLAQRVDITLTDGRLVLVEGPTALPGILALVEGLMR